VPRPIGSGAGQEGQAASASGKKRKTKRKRSGAGGGQGGGETQTETGTETETLSGPLEPEGTEKKGAASGEYFITRKIDARAKNELASFVGSDSEYTNGGSTGKAGGRGQVGAALATAHWDTLQRRGGKGESEGEGGMA
jgi:hypothetical protein